MLSQEQKDGSNPRVKAGINRIFILLFWGYLLNFPIYEIGKIFTKEGLELFLSIHILETLFTITWISITIYLYKLITNTESSYQTSIIKQLFRDGALKHVLFRDKLFNKDSLSIRAAWHQALHASLIAVNTPFLFRDRVFLSVSCKLWLRLIRNVYKTFVGASSNINKGI
jgi:hypothetical protein